MLKISGGDADGAGNGTLASGSMGFEDSAVKTEERSAAIGFRVHPAFDGAKSILHEQGPKLPMRAGRQLTFQHGENSDSKAFARFQDDVANEPIANDDFDFAFEQVMAFDIA